MNLILIGFRGTGKSSIGKRLAESIGYAFLDSDEAIERERGQSISDIFAKEGEAAFRKLETEFLRKIQNMDRTVFSSGGGMPLDEENALILRKLGTVILLNAKPELIMQRLKEDKEREASRPRLMPDETWEREILSLLIRRAKIYAEIAHFELDTSHISPEEAVLALRSMTEV